MSARRSPVIKPDPRETWEHISGPLARVLAALAKKMETKRDH